jgi:hypothetical protein
MGYQDSQRGGTLGVLSGGGEYKPLSDRIQQGSLSIQMRSLRAQRELTLATRSVLIPMLSACVTRTNNTGVELASAVPRWHLRCIIRNRLLVKEMR